MNKKQRSKNLRFVFIVAFLTAMLPIILSQIPGYLRIPDADDILFSTPHFVIVFAFIVFIMIGIPFILHKKYIKDYTKIKAVWFFIALGTITGVVFGEGANPVMLIPYAILMSIFAYFYKKYPWWKVVLTTYLAGMMIENLMNRSPLQVPTLLWVAFFIYPYFWTKIWEHRKKLSLRKILTDFRWTLVGFDIPA